MNTTENRHPARQDPTEAAAWKAALLLDFGRELDPYED